MGLELADVDTVCSQEWVWEVRGRELGRFDVPKGMLLSLIFLLPLLDLWNRNRSSPNTRLG
jgi:hypothetical protein